MSRILGGSGLSLSSSLSFMGAAFCFSFKGIVNPTVSSDVWIFAGIVAPLLVLLLCRLPQSVNYSGVVFCVAAMGSMGVALCLSLPGQESMLRPIGLLLVNVAYIALLIAWTAVYARLNMAAMVIVVAGTYVAGSVIYFLICALPSILVPGITCCLPFFSAALFAASNRVTDPCGVAGIPKKDTGDRLSARGFLPPKLMVLICAYSLLYGTISNHGTAASNILSAGFVGAFLLLVLLIAGRRTSLHAIFRMLLPLMMIGLAVLPFFDSRIFLVNCAISTCYGVAEVVTILMLCDIAHRFRQSALALNAFARLGIGTAFAVGVVMDGALASAGAPVGGAQVAATLVAIIASMVWLVGNYDLKNTQPLIVGGLGAPSAPESDSVEAADADLIEEFIRTRCAELSSEYHLTPRESEILSLLGFGLTAGLIEKELMLSASTVKTHIRHIYSKMGIHSRDELRYLLRADSPSPR